MARTWTCPNCKNRWPRIKQKCPSCGQGRTKPRRPKHQLILETPYQDWVDKFGERCGVCGRPPSDARRLDRDHDHKTGKARGLLCHRCNRALPDWMSVEWLERATAYLRRVEQAAGESADPPA